MNDRTPAQNCRTGAVAAGRPRSNEAAERRRHLIHVAEALFLEKGYNNVSLALIAREARVAVRTIYNGFGGKQGLLAAVWHDARTASAGADNLLDPDSGNIQQVLLEFGSRYLRALFSPAVIRMRRMVVIEASHSPGLERIYREAGPELTRAMLARYFADDRVIPHMREELGPDFLAGHFIACIAGERLWTECAPAAARGNALLSKDLELRLALFLRAVLRPR